MKWLKLSYNTKVHKTPLNTPFALTYAFDPRLPYFDLEKPRKYYKESYAADQFRILKEMKRLAEENVQKASELQKEYCNVRQVCRPELVKHLL